MGQSKARASPISRLAEHRMSFYRLEMTMHHCAVIFDVDGPLLDLTAPESAAFFVPFEERYDLTGLSEDWDSYRVRNDVEIYREILTDHLGIASVETDTKQLCERYLSLLQQMYEQSSAYVSPIAGARDLLKTLAQVNGVALGTATANFEAAAKMRLERAGMWDFVQNFHSGAEGGGAKRDILARVMKRLDLPADRVVFLGDNLNDLDAAQANGTWFIGFHVDAVKRDRLTAAGAETVTGDHSESLRLIRQFLAL